MAPTRDGNAQTPLLLLKTCAESARSRVSRLDDGEEFVTSKHRECAARNLVSACTALVVKQTLFRDKTCAKEHRRRRRRVTSA